jgi:hypothetical protein
VQHAGVGTLRCMGPGGVARSGPLGVSVRTNPETTTGIVLQLLQPAP